MKIPVCLAFTPERYGTHSRFDTMSPRTLQVNVLLYVNRRGARAYRLQIASGVLVVLEARVFAALFTSATGSAPTQEPLP